MKKIVEYMEILITEYPSRFHDVNKVDLMNLIYH